MFHTHSLYPRTDKTAGLIKSLEPTFLQTFCDLCLQVCGARGKLPSAGQSRHCCRYLDAIHSLETGCYITPYVFIPLLGSRKLHIHVSSSFSRGSGEPDGEVEEVQTRRNARYFDTSVPGYRNGYLM